MGANNINLNYFLIILQLVIITYFFYIAFYKIRDIESKRLKIKETQEEFYNFMEISREIIDEYSSVFDLLIKDLEAKIEKAEVLAINFRDIEDKFTFYQQRIKLYEDSQLENKGDYDSKLKKKDYKRVAELAEEGLGITEIAKQLNIGKGEVSLFLNLNRRDKNNNLY
ncbi:MAG TPA: DUF2802 domain-containing protein [Thermoanaerobacterales bacterium]|nr:DUF2802 domain-containing protein [Thermoanaerobacterales bacterium]